MLPSDFDIFAASVSTIPLCIQTRANGRPAASDWAISFSWWGKTRSEPPPWIANDGAQLRLGHHRALDVPAGPPRAPGRVPAWCPRPLCAPSRGRSRADSSFSEAESGLLALVHVLGAAVGELAVAGEAADPEVDVARRTRRRARLDQLGDQRDDPADRLGGQRLGVGPAQAEPVGVLEVGARHPLPRTRPRAPPPPPRRRRSCR